MKSEFEGLSFQYRYSLTHSLLFCFIYFFSLPHLPPSVCLSVSLSMYIYIVTSTSLQKKDISSNSKKAPVGTHLTRQVKFTFASSTAYVTRKELSLGWTLSQEKGVVHSLTPWCSSYRKGSLRVTLDFNRQLYFTLLYCHVAS